MEADEKTPSIVYDDTGVRRLWDKDATLWSDHHQKIHSIKSRLGWLDSPRWLRSQLHDLKKRISLHNSGKGAKFTRGRKWILIYKEKLKSKKEAISREYYIKNNKVLRKRIKEQYK